MESYALKVAQHQRTKVDMIRDCGVPHAVEIISRYPVFLLRRIELGVIVEINCTNWQFAAFHIRDVAAKFAEFEDTLSKIDTEQHSLFLAVRSLVAQSCPALTAQLGEDIATVLICELGSLQRITQIPSKNLKGVGYVKNHFHTQDAYISYHSTVTEAASCNRDKVLRDLCKGVSKAAKADYFGASSTEVYKKQPAVHAPPPKASRSVRRKSIAKEKTKRGGRHARAKRKQAEDRRMARIKRGADTEDVDPSSVESTTSE